MGFNILLIIVGGFLLTTGIVFSNPAWYRDPRLRGHPFLTYFLSSSLLLFRRNPDEAVRQQRMDQVQFGFRIVVGAILIFFGVVWLITGQ